MKGPIQIEFGTDGWRGVIAEDFTFEAVRMCAQAVADYMGNESRGIIVGYDTRFASEHFAAAVAEVLAGNSVPVYLCEAPVPTPVVSHSVRIKGASGAIVITASHNPSMWNGFKLKTECGTSAPTGVTRWIQERLPAIQSSSAVQRMPLAEGCRSGLIQYFDPRPAYLEQLSRLVDLETLRRAGLRVVADPMFGAAAGYFPRILAKGATTITELHGERNPAFPGLQPEPIAANLADLCSAVKETGADLGLATDGDGDRLGVVTEQGDFVSPQWVFALLALYFLEVRGERGPIIKTVTSTRVIRALADLYHVPVYETPVGFKYVAEKMMAEGALIGGEESGGIGFRSHIPERDGILAGLCFLSLMVETGKKPSELVRYLFSKVGFHFYDRIDLRFPAPEREALTSRIAKSRPQRIAGRFVSEVDTIDGWRYHLEDGGWLLVRFSGTEPLLRIYAESGERHETASLLEGGRRLLGI